MRYIIITISILLSFSMYGQTITGKIVNGQKQPIAFVNAILMEADSTFITGDVSDDNGLFQLPATPSMALLKISYVGYKDYIIPVLSRTDMGIIQMEEDDIKLDEVVVKGNLPVTRLKRDAMVTTVENNILSKAGSANDVLAKIPGIIRKDEQFEVFGKGKPLIYLNGRQIRNEQELERLNSDEIKHVELVTNPGSRYDASVKAVIRIQTVKRKGDGFGFDVRSSYMQSQNTDLIDQFQLNYRHSNLDIFGSGYYMHSNTMTKAIMKQENNVDNLWIQENQSNNIRKFDYMNFNLGFNYMISENHSFGLQYYLTDYPTYLDKSDISSTVLLNHEFYDYLDSWSKTSHKYKPIHSLSGYYNGKIGDLNVDLNIDYFKEKYKLESVTSENSQEQADRDIRSLNPVDNQLAAAKLIFTYPIWDGELSWGSEYVYTLRTDDYLSFSTEYIPTSHSKIGENNVAAFADYRHNFNFGQLAVGLRYEHVKFDYYENQELKKDQSRNYNNVYPNISWNKQIGKVQLQLNYTAKTLRPTYSQLSNNLIYINRFTWKKGNSTLKQALTHDVTFSGVWRFLQGFVSFQKQRDAIIQWSNPVEKSPEIALMQSISIDKLSSLMAMVSATPKINCWFPQFSLGIKKQWLTIETSQYQLEMNDPMLIAGFSNTLSLPKGFVLGVDFSFQGKGFFQNVYLNQDIWLCNVSLRKSFLKDALSLELRGNDLFYKRRNNVIVYYNQLIATQKDRMDSREFVFTVRYKFNTTSSKYKGRGAGGDQRKRL